MCIRDSDESVGVVNTDREIDQVNKNKVDQVTDNEVSNNEMSESDYKTQMMNMMIMMCNKFNEHLDKQNAMLDDMVSNTKEFNKELKKQDEKWEEERCQLKVESKQVSGNNVFDNSEEIINKVSYSCENELINNIDKIVENELFKNDVCLLYTSL